VLTSGGIDGAFLRRVQEVSPRGLARIVGGQVACTSRRTDGAELGGMVGFVGGGTAGLGVGWFGGRKLVPRGVFTPTAASLTLTIPAAIGLKRVGEWAGDWAADKLAKECRQ
jgi:hypothetical protein